MTQTPAKTNQSNRTDARHSKPVPAARRVSPGKRRAQRAVVAAITVFGCLSSISLAGS